MYIENGAGAYVWDADGHKLLDLMCGDWLLPLGHCHPSVVEATKTQVENGTTFCSPHTTLGIELADALQRRLPSVERIRFTTSGTEATMTALRLARAFTGRGTIAKMRGGYHGTHDVSLIANGRFQNPDLVPPGLVPGTENSVVLLPYNHVDETLRIIEERSGDLAAVIVEPILGGTGMIPATREYLQALREVTTKHDIVLIFDEVVTFPVGLHGVQGMFGITPDLTTLGKAIGGGLPLGAFGGRADIMDLTDPVLDPSTQMRHATTLGGTPVCLAAGLAQVQALTPEVHDHMDALAERLRSGVRDLATRMDVPLQVTGVAHVFGLHWSEIPVVDFESALASDRVTMSKISMGLLNEGFLMFKSAAGTVSAPMTAGDIDSFLGALEKVLTESGLARSA
ncbi:aspartate aminotransferase family protein [Rhodococcus rhodochrous]|uniref:aspartate aminotransferase family protein n=1 Tax=Rhodococcus rhodochrous TaxID=1829 RepID=UPI001EE6D24A|nr:aminotransferase class III-fold pyridoxal phosphate-dependent enzyme [Rhodococcus rhodochrous]